MGATVTVIAAAVAAVIVARFTDSHSILTVKRVKGKGTVLGAAAVFEQNSEMVFDVLLFSWLIK